MPKRKNEDNSEPRNEVINARIENLTAKERHQLEQKIIKAKQMTAPDSTGWIAGGNEKQLPNKERKQLGN